MAQRQLAQQEVISEAAIAKRESEAEVAWRALQTLQRRRQINIHMLWQKMQVRQCHERKVLEAHFLAEKERHIKRIFWNAWGLAQYIKKVAVIRQLLEHYERKKKQTIEQQQEQIRAALKRRHENEQAEIQRMFDAMLRLQRREAFTFNQQHPGTGAASAAFAAYHPKYEHIVRNGPRYYTHGSAFFDLKDPLSYAVADDLKSTNVKSTSGQATQKAEVRRGGADQHRSKALGYDSELPRKRARHHRSPRTRRAAEEPAGDHRHRRKLHRQRPARRQLHCGCDANGHRQNEGGRGARQERLGSELRRRDALSRQQARHYRQQGVLRRHLRQFHLHGKPRFFHPLHLAADGDTARSAEAGDARSGAQNLTTASPKAREIRSDVIIFFL